MATDPEHEATFEAQIAAARAEGYASGYNEALQDMRMATTNRAATAGRIAVEKRREADNA